MKTRPTAASTVLLIACYCIQAPASERLAEDDSDRPMHLRNAASGMALDESDQAITLSQHETTVLVYNKQSPSVPDGVDPIYHRSGMLHPVQSPEGRTVTAVFPSDHLHQHGIFSAWVRTTWNDREIDFWNLAAGTGRVLHQRVVSTFCNDDAVGFEVNLLHRAVGEPATDILSERWKITAYPTDGSYHQFDLETTQTALTDVPLTINEYHYGGVALRGPTRWVQMQDRDGTGDNELQEASSFLNDLGSDRTKGNHEKARWVSLAGLIAGHPVSVAVLSHRDNFRAPQPARLHPSKPYFAFSPCVEGQFVIDRDHPYHARYRYLVTDAAPDAESLDHQWQDWCGDN